MPTVFGPDKDPDTWTDEDWDKLLDRYCVEYAYNYGPRSWTCASYGWEPPEHDPRPMQKVYPIRHGIDCTGHRELMPVVRERPAFSGLHGDSRYWLNVKKEYL